MNKLTDNDYRLPIIEALRPASRLFEGTTTPMGIWGSDRTTGERKEYVVKLQHGERMSPQSCSFELLGAWMAREVGLFAPEPVIVYISKEFVEQTLRGRDGYKAAYQSIGLNYGSVYEDGFTTTPAELMDKGETLFEQAKMLYVFDLFIANNDRGHKKPNVASDGEELLIFDHELAFSFIRIFPVLRNKTPWIFDDTDTELYRGHHFFNALRYNDIDFAEQVEKLTCFNQSFWDKAFSLMPEPWINDALADIQQHLTSILANKGAFAQTLNQTIQK